MDLHGHHSHAPILAAVAANTTGPILELGVGHGSTPLLHWICAPTKRRLVSVDCDFDWLSMMRWMETPWHPFVCIHDRECWPETSALYATEKWGLVFVDHHEPPGELPARLRAQTVKNFANSGTFVTVHDAHADGIRHYALADAFALYKYQFHFNEYWPGTVVLSNHRPFVEG